MGIACTVAVCTHSTGTNYRQSPTQCGASQHTVATRMHSSRMRTARSLTVCQSRSICRGAGGSWSGACHAHPPAMHAPPPHTPPTMHDPPAMHAPHHTHPPAMHAPQATHAPPSTHAPLSHAGPPAMHAPLWTESQTPVKI